MVNVAICDDIVEELKIISSYVEKILKKLNIAFKISHFNEGEELIEYINTSKKSFDIIFLDIYMNLSNGIDVAKKIRDLDKLCNIVFITSSKNHAIDSYEVRALNYILKPVSEEKLSNTIKIAMENLDKDIKQIIISNKRGNYRVMYNDILYAESKARIVNIHLRSREVISFYSKLDDFIKSLQDERFLRCHKSFIVNMDHILKLENKHIFICNEIKIPISSANISTIKEKYFNYIFKEI